MFIALEASRICAFYVLLVEPANYNAIERGKQRRRIARNHATVYENGMRFNQRLSGSRTFHTILGVWDAWTLYWHPARAGQPALAPCPTRPGNIGPLPNPVVAVPTFKNVWLHLSKSYTTQAVVLSTLYITANSRAYKRCEHDHVTTYTTDHD